MTIAAAATLLVPTGAGWPVDNAEVVDNSVTGVSRAESPGFNGPHGGDLDTATAHGDGVE